MSVTRLATIFAMLSWLTACSGVDLVNALVPTSGYRVVPDIAYGSDPRQRLDLYVPERRDGPLPVVVFFYGGSWQTGDRRDFRFVAQALVARGYLVAVPDYRVYPPTLWPMFLEDSAAAVAWTRKRAAAVAEVAAGPLFLVGHSAGAYNALMLTLDPRWLAAAGLGVCATVRATVGLAGPYDFLPLTDPVLMTIFGPEPRRPRTQPIAYARGDAPPVLLASGAADRTVSPGNSKVLAERIRALGGRAETALYPGIGHVGLIAAFAGPLRWLAPALRDTDRFLQQAAARPDPSCPPAT